MEVVVRDPGIAGSSDPAGPGAATGQALCPTLKPRSTMASIATVGAVSARKPEDHP